jgi:hypothetical protein
MVDLQHITSNGDPSHQPKLLMGKGEPGSNGSFFVIASAARNPHPVHADEESMHLVRRER